MTSLIALLVFSATTHVLATRLVKGADIRSVTMVMGMAWLLLSPTLWLVNLWFPFTEGGDDEDYFYLVATPVTSLSDAFDATRFVGDMAQPGYPFVLSLYYQLIGDDLLALKMFNLALLVMLIPVWYRIGVALESRPFGRAMAVVLVLLTPLWYYAMFLLKDMFIALLESFFLLGLVQISRRGGLKNWLLILVATMALIPFRSQLVLINLAIVVGTVALISMRGGSQGFSKFTALFSSIAVSLALLGIASNPEWMAAIGIVGEDRIIGTQANIESVIFAEEQSTLTFALFPVLYLLSETAAFRPETWAEFDAKGLRAVLSLPWIFVVVPFFVLGFLWLMGAVPEATERRGIVARVCSTRLVATPWGAVVMFILAYGAVSWMSGDTTRWRLSDMPAIAAVALAGSMYVGRARLLILTLWMLLIGVLFPLYYLIRGM